MIGFHVDMNIAQFTRPYLEKWLAELARLGYDTILWEVENNVRWATCPECASTDAFSKEEFREILDRCRALGMEPIPLFQTIGHCEYVLKYAAYQPLAELPGNISQYCPRKPEVLRFLHRWIEEYFDLFGPVKLFHLGADEAFLLGKCPECAAYAEAHSLSGLYIDHVNALIEPVLRRGARPAIWADMVLHRPEALDRLDRRLMLFDWMYDIRRGDGKVFVWGAGLCGRENIPARAMEIYGRHLFPRGAQGEMETFYTADFLAESGFDVVTCPGSSSYGDNVFSPRHEYHLTNTFDSFRKGAAPPLRGSVLTSWTVHLFPWELQLSAIGAPAFVREHPGGSLDEYRRRFARERFGADGDEFWRAAELLSRSCLFSYTSSLGYNKSALPTPPDYMARRIERVATEGRLEAELANSVERLAQYRAALKLFESFSRRAARGRDLLKFWDLAARNLVNRAEASILVLRAAKGESVEAAETLETLRRLRAETQAVYRAIHRPARCAEIMGWMYGAMETALAKLL